MDLEKVFEDNTMWKNYDPSPKIKARKKTTQIRKKNNNFRTFDYAMCPRKRLM